MSGFKISNQRVTEPHACLSHWERCPSKGGAEDKNLSVTAYAVPAPPKENPEADASGFLVI